VIRGWFEVDLGLSLSESTCDGKLLILDAVIISRLRLPASPISDHQMLTRWPVDWSGLEEQIKQTIQT